MGAFYPSGSFLRNQTQIQLTIYVADKLYDSWSNLNEVESDTLQICRDIFQVINSSTRWQTIGKVQSCTVTKFIDKGGDGVAGHQMVFQFAMRDRDGICNLPMENYDFNEQIGDICLPVQIYQNGILVDTIASGGIYSYTTDVFTYTIKNTALTSLYSGNVTANLDVTITDSTAVIKNTLGTTLITESILAQSSEVITAPNGTAKNSDNTYSVAVPSGATVTMPDISFTDSDGITTSVPSNKNITATPAASPTYATSDVMKTGQTVSQVLYDDGYNEFGRLVDFFTLAENNVFGNTKRFTDTLGGQTYTNGIILDHSTYNGTSRLSWYTGNYTTNSATLTNACLNSHSATYGGFATWFVPNKKQMESILYHGGASGVKLLNYAPLNINLADDFWTCTNTPITPTTAVYVYQNYNYCIVTNGNMSYVAGKHVPCRYITDTELGL